MSADREAVAAKIRALRAKTVDNGCTEDEAIAAAAKAAELLQRYNMSMDEAELRASPFKQHDERHSDPIGDRLWRPADAISQLTAARFWVSGPGVHPVEITFFGLTHEVDVARYMLEVCARAMRTAYAEVARDVALLRPAAQQLRLRPFIDGMADRLRERILELIPPTPAGTGLIVLRNALVDAALAEAGIELSTQSGRTSRTTDPQYLAGRRAADRVALNQALRATPAADHLLGPPQ